MARLLPDTQVLLWWLSDDRRLAKRAREAIADPNNEAFASAVSGWEIAIKRGLGKLDAPDDLEDHIKGQGFKPLPVTFGHTERVGKLPRLHDECSTPCSSPRPVPRGLFSLPRMPPSSGTARPRSMRSGH